MKNSLYILITWFFISQSLHAGVIEKNYHFSHPEITKENGFYTLSFPGTMITGKKGEPSLPYRSVFLLIPPGQEAEKIEITGKGKEDIRGSFTIYPAQPSRPYDKQQDRKFYKKESVYTLSKYPEKPFEHFSTAFLHGFGFVITAFTPVNYNPSAGTASYYKDVSVRVFTRPGARPDYPVRKIHATKEILRQIRQLSDNPEEAAVYRSVQSSYEDEYDVLVVTSSAFADSFKTLTDSYLKRGLASRIVTLDSIRAGFAGVDLQEQIRNFIIHEYENHNIKHVLLGGDTDIVPYRGFYCKVKSDEIYESSDIPSDLYFSALDGTWNSDSNDKWGEIGEDDLLPELSAARFPVNSFTELRYLTDKTISYQESPVPGEQRTFILAGEKLWSDPLTFGADYLELLIGFHDDNNYSTTGIPEDFNFVKLYDKNISWTKEDLIQKINSGSAGIHHSGHSNSSYNLRMSTLDVKEDAFHLLNGKDRNFTYLYSNGCYSAAFDKDVSIAEKMVLIKTFAFAYIGNSRYGWFNEGQTEGPSTHIEREFLNALYGDSLEFLGAAHAQSKRASAPWVTAPGQWEQGALRWCFYDCNVLGDPAARLWTDEPVSGSAVNKGLAADDTVFQVSVVSKLENPSGISFTLFQGKKFIARAVTDNYGSALMHIKGGTLKQGKALLTAAGRNIIPFTKELLVMQSGTENHQENSRIIAVTPNPVHQNAVILFYMPRKGDAELSIFNIRGRIVKNFSFRGISEGYNTKVWDGMDKNGVPVGSGIYICRLSSAGKNSSKKLTFIRN